MPQKYTRLLLLLLLILPFNACASFGTEFRHDRVRHLHLGDNLADYRTRFGAPVNTETETREGSHYERLRFAYAQANAAESPSVRVLDLELVNGILNGFNYVSGFDEDRTFTQSTDELPEVGSLRADTLATLGEPSGRVHCPTTLLELRDHCGGALELWTWNRLEPTRGDQLLSTRIDVAFDAERLVIGVWRAESTLGQ